MAKSLEEMAKAGALKLEKKAESMGRSWDAAKDRMIEGYKATPFGPTRKANYEAVVRDAEWHAPDPEKWAKAWAAKMKE